MSESGGKNDQNLAELIIAETSTANGRRALACARAFALAERVGCSVGEIGRMCEELNVKIVSCQLGCFK